VYIAEASVSFLTFFWNQGVVISHPPVFIRIILGLLLHSYFLSFPPSFRLCISSIDSISCTHGPLNSKLGCTCARFCLRCWFIELFLFCHNILQNSSSFPCAIVVFSFRLAKSRFQIYICFRISCAY
jgi:hypothetical protein